MSCDHAPHDDPRFPNTCVKCGQVVFKPRNRPLEDLLHRHAELPQDLLDLVHERTESRRHADLLLNKDWLAEGKEEIADLVNYLTWRMQETNGEEFAQLHSALRAAGNLWSQVVSAEKIGEGWL